ncbi:MAG: hypothetical protein WCX84_09965 [Syntrophales bacterium]|nr:hypothetical protein [Syntrophales bacterium]NLN60924.1 hypothetical protein [Deltaproteobacteria bacterium]
MKRILVVYYSQTGQLKRILDSMVKPISDNPSISIEYLEIRPSTSYPFPWTRHAFLEVFPECVLEKPIRLAPFEAMHSDSYDLIILGFQPWYLSPSLPVSTFLQSPEAKKLFRGAEVLTVIGARNMWIKSYERVKERLEHLGGRLRGNIVLIDRAPNLVSAVTICYWMFTGKKDRCLGLFPPPGVSESDIAAAEKYANAITPLLEQERMVEADEIPLTFGETEINVSLARLENRAKKIFFLWANAITKRPRVRKRLLNIFFVELILALAIVSPVNSLLGLVFNRFHKRRNGYR